MYYDYRKTVDSSFPNRTYKVVMSGSVVEVYEYEDAVKSKKPIIKNHNWDKGDREAEHQKRSRARTCQNIRRLALMNFNKGSIFLTLTFDEKKFKEVTDITATNKEFKKFMQRLRYKFNDFKYLAVIEFQDANGRGAVHYHVLIDGLPFIPANKTYAEMIGMNDVDTFEDIWGLGFIQVNKIKHVRNIGVYLTSYMLKEINDKRLKGKKAYLTSKNLDRPVEITDYNEIQKIFNALELDEQKPHFTKDWMSEYIGQVIYREYHIKTE